MDPCVSEWHGSLYVFNKQKNTVIPTRRFPKTKGLVFCGLDTLFSPL